MKRRLVASLVTGNSFGCHISVPCVAYVAGVQAYLCEFGENLGGGGTSQAIA